MDGLPAIMMLAIVMCAALGLGYTPQERNVLVILADDVGVADIGAYGGLDPANTPTIDALARHGVRFTRAYSNPVCSPTRATIQTGRYSTRTLIGETVHSGGWSLQLQETTLPEIIETALPSVYTFGAFGKWHLGNDDVGGPVAPNLAGWDHYDGALGNISDYYRWSKVTDGVTTSGTTYLTTDEVDSTIDWIREQDRPWIAYLSFHAAHAPLHIPPAHLHSETLSPCFWWQCAGRAYFRAAVEAMDSEVSRLLISIGNELQDTTVIFLGDNGTWDRVASSDLDPSRQKKTVYEGGVHVPFIVTGTDVVVPGRAVDELVVSADVFPTVAELARVELAAQPPGIDG